MGTPTLTILSLAAVCSFFGAVYYSDKGDAQTALPLYVLGALLLFYLVFGSIPP